MPETTKTIIVFNEDAEARARLAALLRDFGFKVLDTPRILELSHMLKTHAVDLVVASQSMDGTEADEFKSLVRTIQPRADVLFVHDVAVDTGNVILKPDEFRRFLHSSITTKSTLSDDLTEFKDFFLTFAERVIQIFSATERYSTTQDHLVARLAHKTALKMRLDQDMANTVHAAALLKDLGMLGIQQQFLEEKRRFTEDELTPIRKHIFNTVQILKQVRFPWNVDAIILQHHENYDGSGYPMGLKGRAIAVGARIVRIADAFVAMISDRPWRAALTLDAAVDELVRNAGTQFDPEVVEAFQGVLGEETSILERKRSFLLIDRDQNIAPLLKLSVEAGNCDLATSSDAMAGLQMLKSRVPDIIIVNVELLEKDYFIHFFNAMYEIPAMQECSYIFVIPTSDHPRHFKGPQVRYLVRPVEMEELSAAIKALTVESSDKVVMKRISKGLRGSLDNMGLAGLVQILNMGLKTAKLELTSEDKWGVIFVRSGNLVHATTNTQSGKEALFELLNWKTGEFQIRHGLETEDINIQADTMHLLHEGSRQKNRIPLP
jgi:response regulator RpfG family c-di-GMP phosphodiesterase